MYMVGRPVFKWAVRVLAESTGDALRYAGVGPNDLGLVVLHQANQRIINAAADHVGFDRSRLFNNLDRYGNTASGSIPLALDEAIVAGRAQRGDLVLLSGFGGGLAWGTMLLRW